MVDPDTQNTFDEVKRLGELAQMSLERRAEHLAIAAYRQMEAVVNTLSNLYEACPVLNDRQPPSFSGENALLPRSLDEWAIGLGWALDMWEAKLLEEEETK